MARHPDSGDRRSMSERDLSIGVWLFPVGGFILGAVFPLFYFVARDICRRGEADRM
jgi:hypothetical protein